MEVHSLEQLFPLEITLLADEDEMMQLPSAGTLEVSPHPSPSDEGEVVWLCPNCSGTQGDQGII